MSHVEFKNGLCHISLYIRPPCHMSLLRNVHVGVSILRKGHVAGSNLVVQTHTGAIDLACYMCKTKHQRHVTLAFHKIDSDMGLSVSYVSIAPV